MVAEGLARAEYLAREEAGQVAVTNRGIGLTMTIRRRPMDRSRSGVCVLDPTGSGKRDSGMTIPPRTRAWATGALVLAAVAGCANNGSDPEPSASPTAVISSPVQTSSSAPPSDPSVRASTEAEAAARKYYAVLDALGSDPKSSLSKLNGVATSTQLTAMRNVLRQQHQHEERQVGSLVVADLKIQSVNLDNSNPYAGKVPVVVVDVCWDVSKVDIVNAAGKSVISPDRPDHGWTRLTVANYRYTSNPDHGWRVASGQDLKQAPCAAS